MQKGKFTSSRGQRGGFSLAEVLVVMVIIGFAATVAVLAYSNYQRGSSTRGAAWEVRSVLISAKTRAIAQNSPSQVVFDLVNQSFWIDDLEFSLAMRTPKAIAPRHLENNVVIDSIRVNSTDYVLGEAEYVAVVFRPDGTNPYVTINLRGTHADSAVDENYYTVQLYPSSAEPRILANARP